MWVGPIKEDGLLGLDFLHAHDYVLSRSALHLNRQSIVCELHGSPVKATRVALTDDVVIPAASQIVVQGETTAEDFASECGVIEPLPCGEKLGVLVGSTLVDPDQGLPVRMMNPTAEDIVLRKGTVVGYMHQVEALTSLHPDESSNKAIEINAVSTAHPDQGPHTSGWPQPLQDLYQSSLGSLDDQQKAQLRLVLGKHVDLLQNRPMILVGRAL